MKCRLYECQNQIQGNYPFCSGTHYQIFQNRKAEMDLWFSASHHRREQEHYDELIEKQSNMNWSKTSRMNHNIEEVELLIK